MSFWDPQDKADSQPVEKKPTASFWDTPSAAPSPKATTTPTTTKKPVSTTSTTTPAVKTPYFAAVDKSGNSFGFSDTENDPSGRALFAYRKPGDTSTTTDRTRVATTFDPRIAQKLTKEQYYNPRTVKNVADIKQQLGGAFNDELDHKIALAVGGSNEKENLQSIPSEKNQSYGHTETELARKVANGEMSYFDAQIADAKQKGISVPFTGKKGFFDTVKEIGRNAVKEIKGTAEKILGPKAEAETGFWDGAPTPKETPNYGPSPFQDVNKKGNTTAESTPAFAEKPTPEKDRKYIGGVEVSDRETQSAPKKSFQDLLAEKSTITATKEDPIEKFLSTNTPDPIKKVFTDLKEGLVGHGQGVDITGKDKEDTGFLGFIRPFGLGKSNYARVSERLDALKEAGVDDKRASDIAMQYVRHGSFNLPSSTKGSIQLTPEESAAVKKVGLSETLDKAFGAFDVIGSISIGKKGAEIIARTADEAVIRKVLRDEIPKLTDEAADAFARVIKDVNEPNQIQGVLNRLDFSLNKAKPETEAIKELPSPSDAVTPKPPIEQVPESKTINAKFAKQSAEKQIADYKAEDIFLHKDENPAFRVIPIEKFNGKDIAAGQLYVDRKGINRWEKRILAGERPAVLLNTSIYDKNQVKISDGHHRLEAYSRLGFKEVPVIDNTGGKLPDINTTKSNKDIYNKTTKDISKETPRLTPGTPDYISNVDRKIEEMDTERMNLANVIENHPARSIQKYVNPRTGELTQALGTGQSKFGKTGDQLAKDLGFNDSESTRVSHLNLQKLKTRHKSMVEDLRTIRELRADVIREGKNTKGPASIIKKLPKNNETYKALASKNKPAQINRSIEEGRRKTNSLANQTKRVQKNLLPELESETPETELEGLDTVQPQISGNSSYKNIVLDTNTPVKKKVGIIDYLRTPDRVLRKLGLGHVADLLRKGYENYLLELPLHLEVIKDWAARAGSDGANKRIFNFLDGQYIRDSYAGKVLDSLSPEELKIAREIRSYLSEWADRLGLPADNKITHYITHIFNLGENEKEFDEDIAKIIKDKVPGSVYDPFLEKRLGKKGYIQDTWAALEAYVKRAVRKANMDPALEKLKASASRLEESQLKYVKRLGDRINLRPTEIDNLLDNTIKHLVGYRFGQRPVALISRKLRQMIFRSMLGLNVGSAVKNLTQVVNTFAKLGTRYTTTGYINLLTKMGNKELEEQGILSQDFIQDRTLTATRKMLEKFDKTLFTFFDMAEKINRGAAYWGAKAKAINAGHSEENAIKYAKKIVRDTQFNFGSIDTPVGLNSDIVKLLTQFTSFGVKQTEFAAEMVKNKEWAGILRYILGSVVIVATIGKIFNIKPQDFIPGYSVLSRFDEIPPALALPLEIIKAISNSPDEYGKPRNLKTKVKDVADAVPYPVKVQAEKTIKGLKTYFDKEKDIKKGPITAVQAAVLGSRNLPSAHPEIQDAKQKQSEDRKKTTSDAQTEYDRMKLLPKDQASNEFEKLIETNPDLAKKVSALATKPELTPQQKGFKFLGVENGRRAQAIFEQLQKLKTKEEKAALYQELIEKKVITTEVQKQLLQLLGQV